VLIALGPALAVVALHALTLHVMAELDVVHALLSPGPHSQLAHLLLGTTFLTLRIAALIGVPGWLAASFLVGSKS
jgi:hypothetical protein